MTREQKTKELVQAVADQYKLTPEMLRGIHRDIPIPEARAVFFYLATRELGLTHSEAAKEMNRKRCNATQQGNKIEYRYVLYPDVRANVDAIKERITPSMPNPYFEMFAEIGKLCGER